MWQLLLPPKGVEKEVTCQKIPNRMDKVEAFERAAI
jgi:hypothetical protein